FSLHPPPPATYTLSLHDALPIYLRHMRQLWRRDPARTAGGQALGIALHRLQAESRRRVSEPLRQQEVRVGSATDALTPLSRATQDRKSTRLNSSHVSISYAVFCL